MNRVFVIFGLGGLGSIVCSELKKLGATKLIVIDNDIVDLHDIPRQLYSENQIGKKKTNAIYDLLKDVIIEKIDKSINELNIVDFFKYLVITYNDFIVLDCFDSLKSKKVLNQACMKFNIPLIHGAALKENGRVLAIEPSKTACLNCIISKDSLSPDEESCAINGILPPVSFLTAVKQANIAWNYPKNTGIMYCIETIKENKLIQEIKHHHSNQFQENNLEKYDRQIKIIGEENQKKILSFSIKPQKSTFNFLIEKLGIKLDEKGFNLNINLKNQEEEIITAYELLWKILGKSKTLIIDKVNFKRDDNCEVCALKEFYLLEYAPKFSINKLCGIKGNFDIQFKDKIKPEIIKKYSISNNFDFKHSNFPILTKNNSSLTFINNRIIVKGLNKQKVEEIANDFQKLIP